MGIGYVTAISFAVDCVMFPIAGQMLDRLGRIPTGDCSMLGLGGAIFFLQWESFAFYMVFAVVSGLFNGMSAGIVQIMAADLAPAECRSQFVGVFRTISKCADIVAPAIVGGVAEVTSLKIAELVVVGISIFGSVWALLFARETLRREPPDSVEVREALAPYQIGKRDEVDAMPETPAPTKEQV